MMMRHDFNIEPVILLWFNPFSAVFDGSNAFSCCNPLAAFKRIFLQMCLPDDIGSPRAGNIRAWNGRFIVVPRISRSLRETMLMLGQEFAMRVALGCVGDMRMCRWNG